MKEAMGALSGILNGAWLSSLTGQRGKSRAGVNSRRHPRYSVTGIRCALGEIANISVSGACVRCVQRVRLAKGQRLRLYLRSGSQQLQVDAVLVRQQRRGLKVMELGFAFVDVSPSLAAALESLGRFGFISKPKQRQNAGVIAEIDLPDHYKALGVSSNATTEQIHDAFRTMARQFHPDVNKDPA